MCGRAPPHPLTASTRSPPPIHPLTCRLLHPSSLHLRVHPTPRHTPPLHQYILVLLSPLFSQHFSPLLILPPPDSHSASLPFFPVFQSLIFPTHTHTSCCSLRLLLLRNTVPLCVDVIITQHLLLLWNTDEQQERDNKRTTEQREQNKRWHSGVTVDFTVRANGSVCLTTYLMALCLWKLWLKGCWFESQHQNSPTSRAQWGAAYCSCLKKGFNFKKIFNLHLYF